MKGPFVKNMITEIEHIEVIARSADLGDILIIGVNTDNSIKRLKGKNRPIVEEISRAKQLAALEFVDEIIFVRIQMIYGYDGLLFYMTLQSQKQKNMKKELDGHFMLMNLLVVKW